jgi:hypothetical protein
MMKFIYSLFTVLILINASSCKKFLETEPTDFFLPSSYYKNEKELNIGLAGVYDMLGSTKLYGAQLHTRHNFEADEGFYNAESQVNGPTVHNYTANDPEIRDFWRYLYIGVTRANAFLKAIDGNKEIAKEKIDLAKGEALFLRGYYYFLLVQNFGPVPLVLIPTTDPNDINIPKSSEKDVYAQIINDMEEAEGLVDPIRKIGFGGRISKSAVRGILARVCLNMAGEPLNDFSKYERASYWAKKVMDDAEAGHKLNPDFSQIFINYAADRYDIDESIWEVEFFGNNTNASQEAGYIGSWIGIRNTLNNDIGYGFGRISVTAKLIRTFEIGDMRKDWSVNNFIYKLDNGKSPYPAVVPNNQLYYRFPAKYRREFEVVLPKASQQTPINWPLLRYADILLMYAEAENEVNGGPTNDAMEAINKVRRRGFGLVLAGDANNTKYDLPSNLSKYKFFRAIVDERSRELNFEGLRRADLIRWGIFVETMKETLNMMEEDALPANEAWKKLTYKNVSSKHIVYPTPAYELELNKMLIQHPLWR